MGFTGDFTIWLNVRTRRLPLQSSVEWPVIIEVRNPDKLLRGNDRAFREVFRLANSGITNSDSFRRIAELVDLPAFADFMLVNLYGANADWDRSSNWYAMRRMGEGGRFVLDCLGWRAHDGACGGQYNRRR